MQQVILVIGGAFVGGFVSGLAGFGTGLVALGIWLYAIEPVQASTLVAACSVIAQLQTIPAIWHAVNHRRVWPMVGAGLLGVPLGTVLLSHVDAGLFRLGVGAILVGFSSFMLLGGARSRISWGGGIADNAVGFAGGVLGGLAGLSGPLPTMWATLRGWAKDERRGVFQVFNLTILASVVVWHALSGLLTAEVAKLILLACPGTLSGAWLGVRTYRRLSDKRFNDIVLGLLALSGLALLWAAE